MTTSTVFACSDHAVERFCQRFPHLVSVNGLLEAFARSREVSARTLIAEAKHCGRPVRIARNSQYRRDDEQGVLFVLKPHRKHPGVVSVVTIIKFRRPAGFVESSANFSY